MDIEDRIHEARVRQGQIEMRQECLRLAVEATWRLGGDGKSVLPLAMQWEKWVGEPGWAAVQPRRRNQR